MKRRWFLAIISVFVVVFLVLVWQNEQIKTICDSNRIYCQTDSDCMCTSCGVDSKICNYFHDMGFLCEYNICMNEIEDSTSTVRCSENKCILVEFNDLNPTISYDWMKYNCRVDSDCSMAGAEEMGDAAPGREGRSVQHQTRCSCRTIRSWFRGMLRRSS